MDALVFEKGDVLKEFNNPKPNDDNQKKKFNQDAQAKHILPSFPYQNEERLLPGVMFFSKALRTVPSRWLLKKQRRYKLNSPYIQQLRQRFLTSHGRVGVPAINNLVKVFNLGQIKDYKSAIDTAAEKATQDALKTTNKPVQDSSL
ncbi:MAG: hypothetical protein LH606_13630 [Cytophagaceae bacterium]|nr:hypothetical protein [Cytophagaceae bacterium]